MFVLGFKDFLYFIFSKSLDHSFLAFYSACKLQQHLPFFSKQRSPGGLFFSAFGLGGWAERCLTKVLFFCHSLY